VSRSFCLPPRPRPSSPTGALFNPTPGPSPVTLALLKKVDLRENGLAAGPRCDQRTLEPLGRQFGEILLREEDLEHVAVLDEVGLALGAQAAVLARLGHRAELEEVLVGHRLGPDEAPGQVGVDRPGGIDGGRTRRDRPGADLVGAGGQEADQAQQPVRQGDHPVEARAVDPELLHECPGLVGLELAQLHLDPGGECLDQRAAMDIAIRDNRNCRMLIESEWYQSLFSDVFQMSGDQNVKSFWENDRRGYRLATAVRGAGTGKRGTMLIIDDPNNAMAGVAEIEAVREWFGRTWQGRLNNQESGAMITVGQRLSEKDLTSHLLRLGGWEHCNLPTEYEPDRKSHTSIGWSDPRTIEGELLCPELLSAQSIQDLKHSIGSMNYAAQYQQSPVPADGGTFKKQWIRYFTETPDAYVLQKTNGTTSVLKSACWRFTVVDLAISSKQTADYTVIQTYDVTPHKDLILIDQIRDRMDNPEQLKTLKMVHARLRPMFFKVESIAYQLALTQQLKQVAIPVREYRPTRDKVSRASVAAILMENEKFFFRQGDPYLLVLEPELLMFPLGAHDDQVDDLSAAGDEVGMPHPTGGVYIPTAADLVGDGDENMALLEDDRRW